MDVLICTAKEQDEWCETLAACLPEVDSGQLAEAFLDVFQRESLPRDHRYWTHPRVRVTPHVAALTPFAIACGQVARKIRQLESGESITGIVDRSRGY